MGTGRRVEDCPAAGVGGDDDDDDDGDDRFRKHQEANNKYLM